MFCRKDLSKVRSSSIHRKKNLKHIAMLVLGGFSALAAAASANASISHVASTKGVSTASLGSHQAGDILIAWATRDGSSNPPTVPAGWTVIYRQTGANSLGYALAWKKATSSNEVVGNFTSATSLIVSQYRPLTGYEVSIGARTTWPHSSSLVAGYQSLPLQATNGTSWIVGFLGHRSSDLGNLATAPTGMINRISDQDSVDSIAVHDTNGGVSSWSARSVTHTGTASAIRTAELELIVTPVGTTGIPAPSYTPLINNNFEGNTSFDLDGIGREVGRTTHVTANTTTGGVMNYAHPTTGSKSVRIDFAHERRGFGFTKNLPGNPNAIPADPQVVRVGDTLWYRVDLYMPSTLSLSYAFDQINNPEVPDADGFGWNKFLVMSRLHHEGPRMYVQPRSDYRLNYGSPEFNDHTGIYVNHDEMGTYCPNLAPDYSFPRNQWFSLQVSWHVATDHSAYIRVWSDDKLIAECQGAGRVSAGYEVGNIGIGDYWNGGAWIQGASTGSFWMDNLVVTKQTPNTVDSEGRPFIHPQHFR